jgi:hypothetical protein
VAVAGRVKVLSVVGPGRSGTTVIGNILGQQPGWTSVGELRWLWRRGLLDGRPCGCGRPLPDCLVWTETMRRVDARLDPRAPSADQVVSWQEALAPLRRRLHILRSTTPHEHDPAELVAYTGLLDAVYAEIAAVSGAHVVVDTSKRPHDATIAARATGVDHYVVHILRDPRATAFSWGRVKPLPAGEGQAAMATRSPISAAARWIENTVGTVYLRRRIPASRWLFLRYEDFARDPRGAVLALARLVGEPGSTESFSDPRTVRLATAHTVSGNPDRFRAGPVRIAEDDAWRRQMRRRDRLVVGTVTLPWLLRYGYLTRRAGRSSTALPLTEPQGLTSDGRSGG